MDKQLTLTLHQDKNEDSCQEQFVAGVLCQQAELEIPMPYDGH